MKEIAIIEICLFRYKKISRIFFLQNRTGVKQFTLKKRFFFFLIKINYCQVLSRKKRT